MGSHLIDGRFQSDKYPSVPPDKFPMSFTDPAAQDLIYEYAQRRRAGTHGSREIDRELADDVEARLRTLGFLPRHEQQWRTMATTGALILRDVALDIVINAAREATCDTHTIPACVRLGEALRAYDKARGAVCPTCDGIGTIDGPEDDVGEGPLCSGCGGKGLIEPTLPAPADDAQAKLEAGLAGTNAAMDRLNGARTPTPDVPAALVILRGLLAVEGGPEAVRAEHPRFIETRLRAAIAALGGSP